MLIAARAVLGIGGATLMPSTLALIRNMFHDAGSSGPRRSRSGRAVMTGGIALGPVLGGFLLEHFWWGSVFLINIPAMVLLLVLAPMLLPEFKRPRAGRFDLIGSVLSLAAVLPVIYGIKELAATGASALPVAVDRGRAGLRGAVRAAAADAATRCSTCRCSANRAFSGSLVANTIGSSRWSATRSS